MEGENKSMGETMRVSRITVWTRWRKDRFSWSFGWKGGGSCFEFTAGGSLHKTPG